MSSNRGGKESIFTLVSSVDWAHDKERHPHETEDETAGLLMALEFFVLEGRSALVTGGGKGLARMMAQALAEAEANIAVASRDEDTCAAAAKEITETTGRRAIASKLGSWLLPLENEQGSHRNIRGTNQEGRASREDGTDNDLKGMTVFLGSETSRYVTGQVTPVDGGTTAAYH